MSSTAASPTSQSTVAAITSARVYGKALRSGGCFGDVCPDVLAHRVQLAGKWGERAEASLLAERSAGTFQRIQPFLDDLPGRILVRQQEDGGAREADLLHFWLERVSVR